MKLDKTDTRVQKPEVVCSKVITLHSESISVFTTPQGSPGGAALSQ